MTLPLPLPLAPSRRRGVTLIEVVIAIFVLSIGILGIMSLFPAGYQLTRRAVERSTAALAARHALARVYGRGNLIVGASDNATTEPLSAVTEPYRVGTVATVAANQLTCFVLGNGNPSWPNLAGYYFVMTSGSADGHFYRISSGSGNTLNFDARFNMNTERAYEPVRVGDHFAIIGAKTGTLSFPAKFLSTTAAGSDLRTVPVATYGKRDAPKDQWRYSYACVFSASSPEMRQTLRLDIFVYRGFPYKCDTTPTGANRVVPEKTDQLMIGHFVAYLAGGAANLQGT